MADENTIGINLNVRQNADAEFSKFSSATQLAVRSASELNDMVLAGTITGEQFRAALGEQIAARERDTAATVEQTTAQTNQNAMLAQSWEKVMMTMGKTGTDSPATALEAINTAAANGVAPLNMQNQLLQGRFNLVQQWIQSGEVATWQELNVALKGLDQTTVASTTNSRQYTTEMRGGRFEVMSLMMIMMEFNTVMDGNTKSMTVVREGVMAMANSMMVLAMLPPQIGVPLAALTATLGALGIAAKMAADPDIDALNKALDTLGQKDDAAIGLAKLTDATNKEAQAALDFAKDHSDAANELKSLVDQVKPGTLVISGLGDIFGVVTNSVKAFFDGITQSNQIIKDFGDNADKTGKILGDAWIAGLAGIPAYIEALAEGKNLVDANRIAHEAAWKAVDDHANAAQRLTGVLKELAGALELEKKATEDAKNAAQAMASLQNDVASGVSKLLDLQVSDQQKLVKSARDANSQIANDWRSLQDGLAQISFQRVQAEENNNRAIFEANQAMDDAIFNANRELNNALDDDAQKLADSQFKAQQTLSDSLSDLGYQHQKQEQDLANQLVTAQVNAANSISKAYRDMLQALASEDWNVHESLENAKTENEREQILERAAHERAGIREKFGNTIDDAEARITEEKRVAAVKKQLAEEDLAHSILIDQRKYNEEIASAQKVYAEQVALAQRRDSQAIDDARKRDAEQLASLGFRLAQEEEALNNQAANSRKRYDQQVADIRAHLVQEVMDTIAAENAKAMALASEIQARMMNLALIIQTAEAEAQLASAYKNSIIAQEYATQAGQMQGILGRAGGGSVMGGRTYLVGENGPELLRMPSGSSGTIIPNSTSNYGGNTIYISIDGSKDTKAVAEEIRKVLSDSVWQ